eukprot:scaffold13265_cov61-Phaeocystis_antarctica.AAC.5
MAQDCAWSGQSVPRQRRLAWINYPPAPRSVALNRQERSEKDHRQPICRVYSLPPPPRLPASLQFLG